MSQIGGEKTGGINKSFLSNYQQTLRFVHIKLFKKLTTIIEASLQCSAPNSRFFILSSVFLNNLVVMIFETIFFSCHGFISFEFRKVSTHFMHKEPKCLELLTVVTTTSYVLV